MTERNNHQTKIVECEDVIEFSLHRRVIYGLNIFHVNDVVVNFDDEPLIVFLKTLADKLFYSVHTGDFSNFAALPDELFGDWVNNHLLSQTSLFESYFYDNSSWQKAYPSVVFPTIDKSFWTEKLADGHSSLVQVLAWRAIALYLNEQTPDLNEVSKLTRAESPGHEDWIKQITKLYKLLLLPDNNYVYIYAREKENFELLNEALGAATEVIKQNQWFKENKDHLVWDDNLVNCLTLKM